MSGSILTDGKLKSSREINGFSFFWQTPPIDQDLDTTIDSPHFKSGNKNEFNWVLSIYPYAHNGQSKDFLSVRLAVPCPSPFLEDTRLYVVLSFIDKDDNESMTREVFFKLKEYQSERYFDFPKKDVFSENHHLLIEGMLTIKIIIYHTYDDNSGSGISEYRLMGEYDGTKKLLGSKRFSDIKFIFSDGVIYAHKNILSLRSEVFSVMFEHDMQENIKNEVQIVDVSKDVMMELFRFIYEGKVNNLKTIAPELLLAADKYGIMELKNACKRILICNLSTDNAWKIFEFSNIYNIDDFKAQVTKYIVDHIKDFAKMENFDTMISSCQPPMLCLLLKSLAQRDL